MCNVSTGKQVVQMNTLGGCSCGCTCQVELPISDEIRRLEEHKKILQDRIDTINTKITALKTVTKP